MHPQRLGIAGAGHGADGAVQEDDVARRVGGAGQPEQAADGDQGKPGEGHEKAFHGR